MNIYLFLILGGCITLCIIFFLLTYVPHLIIRFFNWLLIHTFYKISLEGKENIPNSGALLISNHITYLDAAIIQACLERPVRFLMYKPIYDHPLIYPIVSKLGAIPIEPGKKENVDSALALAQKYIKEGDLVCIFPEGSISRIGTLLPFKRGMEKIMEGIVDQPIIPIYLDQLWGSIFSFHGGKSVWKIPRKIPYPLSISFGKQLKPDTSANEAYLKIEELGSKVFDNRKEIYETLPYQAISALKKASFKITYSDSTGLCLRSISLISLSIFLAKKLKSELDSKIIAIHLPNGIASASLNIALHCLGKITTNLNGTVSSSAIDSCFTQTKSNILITSKKYQEVLEIKPPKNVKVIYIENTIKELNLKEKILNHLQAALFPTKILLHLIGTPKSSPQEVATIIFSSGSTGTPKGVMLSHKNIISNVYSVSQIYDTDSKDKIFGCLPFFHAFGYTFTFWYPILQQISANYYPNPLDAKNICKLIEQSQATFLFSTPTFLQLYLKKCDQDNFKNIKEILVGAEKLSSSLSKKCIEKIGIEPKEGYGCTELSPLALVNTYDYVKSGHKQKGIKRGTVGLPIPGVAAKIVNPETFEELEHENQGLLLIRGPNVMVGYLENEKLTRESIKEGWYITGDMAKRDSEGFVTITDRLSRFSKIGGEMVPHIKIEESIQEIIGTEERVCIVSGIRDNKKSEKLAVLILDKIDIDDVLEKLKKTDLPNLWIPKKEDFVPVPSLPLLASGKININEAKLVLANKTLRD